MKDLNAIISESLQMFNKWSSGYSEGQPVLHPNGDVLKSGDTNFSQDGQPATHSNETTLKNGGGSDDWFEETTPTLHSGKTVLQEGVLEPNSKNAYGNTLGSQAEQALGMKKKKAAKDVVAKESVEDLRISKKTRFLNESAGVFVKKLFLNY